MVLRKKKKEKNNAQPQKQKVSKAKQVGLDKFVKQIGGILSKAKVERKLNIRFTIEKFEEMFQELKEIEKKLN